MSETRIEIVVSGDNAEATLEHLVAQLPDGAAVVAASNGQETVADAFEQALAAAGDLPSMVAQWWHTAQAGDGAGPVLALLLSAVIFAAAYGVERAGVAVLARRADNATAPGQEYSDRVRAAARWGLLQVLRLALFYVICRVGIAAVAGSGTAMAALAPVLLAVVMRFRILTTLVRFLAGAGDPSRRLAGLTDDEANHVMRTAYILMACLAVLLFFHEFIVSAVGAGQSGVIFAIAMRGAGGLLAVAFFFAVRRPVARLIGSAFAPAAEPGTMAAIVVKYWYVLYALLVGLTVAADSRGYLAPEAVSAGAASSYSFQIFILTPFILAGLRIWCESRIATTPDEKRGMVMGVFALLEGVVLVLAAVLVLLAWDIDPFATDVSGARRMLPGLVSASLVIVVGVSIWRTASAFLDVYAPELPEGAEGGIPDGEGGVGGSRLETVFPIFRIAAAVVIVAMTVMLALSALGVELGPLIAGAGVVGLAFGFGAQTLVKDIISGIFYLYEDAFRVGEYIQTSEGKGIVEKILLRSVRLRHHRGAIFTIPFGSMGTIQNHSRDWVKVKFTFEVPPEEDLERVRKLIKKVGVALAEDADLKGKFIEPLKSQGAVAMVGRNYQIGVKFICPPGQQFMIRRKAFAAIQKSLRENGIELSVPHVVVDSPGDLPAAAAVAAAASEALPPAKG
ncbi:MAG: mechanosensitive ion channel domain-containing protein [Alphaproteobacteria bacterium]